MSVFKNATTRVQKINEPLLVIGLGGTGLDGLLRIKDTFARRFVLPRDEQGNMLSAPSRTAYLEIDTDSADKDKHCNGTKLDPGEFVDLTVQGLPAMLANPAFLKPYQHEWLQERYTYDFINGAGGIRQAGRLLFMLKAESIYNKLKGIVTNLLAIKPGETPFQSISIVIVTGISGGTGSGIFLDVPYMLQHIMTNHFGGFNCNITGYIVTPDVSIARAMASGTAQGRILAGNGFAALKELDYWMGSDRHKHEYIQQYSPDVSVNWADNHPYDDVVLLSSYNADGSMITNSYEVVMELIAENQLNYMAFENPAAGAAAGTSAFTYRSHKVNVFGQIQVMDKPYPSNYAYTAIGAFATDPQQDEMVDYEASLVMNNIASMASREPDLESNEVQLFGEEIVPLKGRYGQVKTSVRLPDWEVIAQSPTVSAANDFRATHEEYHTERLDKWRRQIVVKSMKSSFFGDPDVADDNGFIQDCWMRFCNKAQEIIKNMQKGPYYLEKMLIDEEKGLVHWLDQRIKQADGDVANAEQDIANHIETAKSYYPKVLNPSLIDRGLEAATPKSAPFGRYMSTCADIYEATRKCEYARQLSEMLKTFKAMVEGYTRYSLHAYNDCVLELNEQLTGADRAANTTGTLVDFAQLRASIQNRYNELNDEDGMTKQLLSSIAEQSVNYTGERTVANARAEKARFRTAIESFINQAFQQLNAVNLDNMLQIAVGPTATAADKVNEVVNNWGPRLKESAAPMFASHPAMANDAVVNYGYVSVPLNAPSFINGIAQYASINNIGVTQKQSSVTERVFWLQTMNGLPLCRYSMLERFESEYEARLADGDRGLHLEGVDTGARMDWQRLPSPLPHTLMGAAVPSHEAEVQADAVAVLRRAMEYGMLEINKTNKEYTLHMLQTAEHHMPSLDDFADMMAQLKAGDTQEGVLENADYWQGQINKADSLRSSGKATTETVGGAFEKFAPNRHFITDDYQMRVGMTREEQARVAANIALLIEDLVIFTLSRRPYTVMQIKRQLGFFEEINAYKAECQQKLKVISGATAVRTEVAAYAPKVAMLMMYQLIAYKLGKGYIFQDAEYHPEGIALFKPGSEVAPEVVKYARDVLLVEYLNSLDEYGDKELMHELLDQRENSLEDLTEQELLDMKKRCQDLAVKWQKSMKELRANARLFSRKDLDYYCDVYSAMEMTVSTRADEIE